MLKLTNQRPINRVRVNADLFSRHLPRPQFFAAELAVQQSEDKPANIRTKVDEGQIRWLGGADEAKHVHLVDASKRRSADTALVERHAIIREKSHMQVIFRDKAIYCTY